MEARLKHLLLLAAALAAGCGRTSIDVPATVAAGLALTDTALVPPEPSVTPTATLAPEPTVTRTPTPRPTSTPKVSATRISAAADIAYGEKKSHGARNEAWLYAFQGTDGDDVTVAAWLSSTMPAGSRCAQMVGKSTVNYELQTDEQREIQPIGPQSGTNARSYRLSYTGLHYIALSCTGPGCNGFCAQVDTSLELKPRTQSATPSATRIASAEAIAYGQTKSQAPRTQPWIYSFEGSTGADIAVSVAVSNLRPDSAYCVGQVSNTTASYTLQTSSQEKVTPIGSAAGKSSYLLPDTGLYYIVVACEGRACNAGCAQVDTRLELKTRTGVATPSATRVAAARDISYGEKKSYGPHGETWLYGFDGTEGDDITISVTLSNGTSAQRCAQLVSNTTAPFRLLDDLLEEVPPLGRGVTPNSKTFQLGYSGLHYIAVTCAGAGCNGWCAQVDTSLELKP